MILQRLAAWKRKRRLEKWSIHPDDWQVVLDHWPLLGELSPHDRERLRDLASLFLHAKTLEGVGGLQITPPMAAAIAAQACLPVLNLGLDALRGWYSVLVYPETFVSHMEEVDEDGVWHVGTRELAGEAWDQGPLILAWGDARPDHPERHPGNVVIHEIAHKLDMLNGAANGMPPLHRAQSRPDWTHAFHNAWEALGDEAERHPDEELSLDPYALTDPGEFFAVASESFFVDPHHLSTTFPELYHQLALFYRQDPLTRRPPL